MDVSIRLLLNGGHNWEFVCAEDDPMVFGLVSALPGAKLDASLPADGLIQIEARNGQRFFLSRSSLVALTITRLPAQLAALAAGVSAEKQQAELLPPFVMRENVFDRATAEAFLEAAARHGDAVGHCLQDIDMDALPPAAAEALVGVLADARTRLARDSFDETHISVGVRRLSGLPSARLLLPAASHRLIDFIVWLPGVNSGPGALEVSLPDLWLGRINDASKSAQTISMAANTALVFPSADALKAIDLHLGPELGAAVIISGSLCRGVGVERR